MYATYTATTPGMKLNIRNAPNGDCVGELADGTTKPIEKAERGWCELADGEGFIDARFVAITAEPPAGYHGDAAPATDNTEETGGSETTETGGSETEDDPKAGAGENPADDGGNAGDGGTAEPPAGDEAAELRKMTNPQLYKLAENSGIKVKKGMNKDALIAAILAGSDD